MSSFFDTSEKDAPLWSSPPPIDPKDQASNADLWNTAKQGGLRSEQLFSDERNIFDAYERHNKTVKDLTGVDLPNPGDESIMYGPPLNPEEHKAFINAYDQAKKDGDPVSYRGFRLKWREDQYRKTLDDLAIKHPELRDQLIPKPSFEEQGLQLRRDALWQEHTAWEKSGKGLMGWTAWIGGKLHAQGYDPMTYITAPIGFGGAGAGAKGLLTIAAKQALANASVEAVMQGMPGGVLEQQRRANLPGGAAEFFTATGTAAAFGAILDPLITRMPYRGFKHLSGHQPVFRNNDKNDIIIGWRKGTAEPFDVRAGEPVEPAPAIPPELMAKAEKGDPVAQKHIEDILKGAKTPDEMIPHETMVKAMDGDPAALRKATEADARLDPEIRKELDFIEADDMLAKPRDTVSDAEHLNAIEQNIRHVADPDLEPPIARIDETPVGGGVIPKLEAEIKALREQIAAGKEDTAIMDQIANIERQIAGIDDFGSDPLRDAQIIRSTPEVLTSDINPGRPGVRTAKSLAALSDEAFDMVRRGEATPEAGALVADFVAGKEYHAPILSDLMKSQPASVSDGRRILADILQTPEYRRSVNQPEFDELIDDPAGTDAKAQVDRLERSRAEELAQAGLTDDLPTLQSVRLEEAIADLKAQLEALKNDAQRSGRMDVDYAVQSWSFIRDVQREKKPQSLYSWLIERKGLKDDGGEVSSLFDTRRRIINNKNGMSLDDATNLAWQAGYLQGTNRPSINEFLDVLRSESQGQPVYRETDAPYVERKAKAEQLKNELSQAGLGDVTSEKDIRERLTSKQPQEPTPEQIAAEKQAKDAIKAAEEAKAQAEALKDAAIARVAQIKSTIADLVGVLPEGTPVHVYDGLEGLPPVLAEELRNANTKEFIAAVKAFNAAQSKLDRIKATEAMEAARRNQVVEGFVADGSVFVATYAMNPRARFAHEAMHFLRQTGRVAPEEIAMLASEARRLGVFDDKLQGQYRRAYAHRYDEKGLGVAIDEEAAVHLVESVVRGDVDLNRVAPQSMSIIDKIKKIFESVRTALTKQGFRPDERTNAAQDVVTTFLSGEMAKRQRREEWTRFAQMGKASEAIAGDIAGLAQDLRARGEVPVLRREDGLVSQVDVGGQRYAIERDAEGAITGLREEAISDVQDVVSGVSDGYIAAQEALSQQALNGIDPAALAAVTQDMIGRVSSRVQDIVAKYSDRSPDPQMVQDMVSRVMSRVMNGEDAREAVAQELSALVKPSDGGVMFAMRNGENDVDRLGYFSGALRAARNLRQDKGTPEQMLAMLMKEGAKKNEIEATGVDKFIMGRVTDAGAAGYGRPSATGAASAEGRTAGQRAANVSRNQVTKQEIIKYLEDNRVDVSEVQRGLTPEQLAAEARMNELRDRMQAIQREDYQRTGGFRDEKALAADNPQYAALVAEYDALSARNFGPDRKANEPTKWSPYSLDPNNPTYRETVLHLPTSTELADQAIAALRQKYNIEPHEGWGKYATPEERAHIERLQDRAIEDDGRAQFRSGHFPEPNIVGHMMTSMVKHEGKATYLIDQIQSDWGQKLRDGGVRDEAKIAELKKRVDDIESTIPQEVLDEKALELVGRPWNELNPMAQYNVRGAISVEASGSEAARLRAELETAEAATPGHPLVNTTDQWTNTTLRRAIRQAVEADAEYIAIPHGDTVLSYNPGQEGMLGFYGSRTEEGIVPKNLRKLLQKMDRNTPPPQRVEKLETSQGAQGWNSEEKYPFDKGNTGFTIVRLTDKVKQSVISEGQPMFALRDLSRRLDAPLVDDLAKTDPHPGRVMAVHGTKAQPFDQFDPTKSADFGIHFGTRDQADIPAGYTTTRENARMIPVVLDLKTVVDVPDMMTWPPVEVAHAVEKAYPLARGLEDRVRAVIAAGTTETGPTGSARPSREALDSGKAELRRLMTEAKIDGLRYWNDSEGEGWSYIVWDEGKVTSATSGEPMMGVKPDGAPMFALRDLRGRIKPGAEQRVEVLKREAERIRQDLETGLISDREALQMKRAGLLRDEKGEILIDDIYKYQDPYGRKDLPAGYLAAVESTGRTALPGSDFKTLTESYIRQAHEKLAEMDRFFFKGAITGDRRRFGKWVGDTKVKTTAANIFREAAGQNTGDAVAKEFAKRWLEVAEWLRQKFNAVGGDIGKLKGWYAPQYHDPDAMLKAGKEAWVKFLMAPGMLDHVRMGITRKELRQVLDDVWDAVTTDGKESPITTFGGALYKRHNEHRVLHFKDADGFLKYAEAFGGGDVYAMMIGHINMMARDIAALERFGPNPNITRAMVANLILDDAKRQRQAGALAKSLYDELSEKVDEIQVQAGNLNGKPAQIMAKIHDLHKEFDGIRTKARQADRRKDIINDLYAAHQDLRDLLSDKASTPEQKDALLDVIAMSDRMLDVSNNATSVLSKDPVDRAQSWIARADEMFKNQMGTTNTPVNRVGANLMQGFRNVTGSTMLSAASISALSDQATSLGARQFIGMPKASMLTSLVKAFSRDMRETALKAGLGLEQVAHAYTQQARFIGSFDVRGWTGFLADRTHAFSGLAPLTQATKTAFAWDFVTWMADLARTKAFKDLEPWTQRMLTRHGLTPEDWADLRTVKPETYRGVEALTRKAIADQVGGELASKYMRVLIREQGMGIIDPTSRGRTAFVGELRAGTIKGEIARSFAMLKSFPTSYALLVVGRMMDVYKARQFDRAGIGYIASIIIMGTVLGGLVRQLKNINYGKDPEPMDNTRFWVRSFLQSGGAGIWGDFLASSVNRFGGGFGSTLSGPVFDQASSMYNLTVGNLVQYAQDEPTNIGREVAKSLKRNTPVLPFYLRLAYERMLIDELQKQLDPNWHRSFTQTINRSMQNFGNEYYWPPGSFNAERAPRFDKMFGEQR